MSLLRATSLTLVVCIGASLFATALGAQEEAQPVAEPNTALRVFLDCDRGCDFDYIRQEVDFINWVRDRNDGQVHVLVTRQGTGGGLEFRLEFIGREEFVEQDQVLLFASSGTDTRDERRRGFARTLRLGLARYIAQTPMASMADLVVTRPAGTDATESLASTPENDPWNAWVFSLGFNGSSRSEQRTSSREVEGNVRAVRVTDAWKIRLEGEGDYSERQFEFDDGSEFRDVFRSLDAGGQVVKTLGERWGAGIGASIRQSSFFNLTPSYRAAAALEYNLFPYTESSQKQLTFTYFLGANRFNYREETIFEKTTETLVDQGFIVSLDLNQPWGSANLDFEAMHFVQDPGQFNLEFRGHASYRILRGLNLDLFGGIESIRVQRYLPAGGASDEEILLERRALATDFRFFAGLGIRYTFGSIYNNVVNARLGGNARGFHSIF